MADPVDVSAIQAFRDAVPAEVRDQIKLRLLENAAGSLDGFLDATQFITAHILAGDIPPEVADAARKYLELMLTAIVMQNMRSDGALPKPSKVMDRLQAANKRAQKMLPEYGAGAHVEVTAKGFVATKK